MNFITFRGGPLDQVDHPKTLNMFISDGVNTLDKPDQHETNADLATYVLTCSNPPTYTYRPKRLATNGLVKYKNQ